LLQLQRMQESYHLMHNQVLDREQDCEEVQWENEKLRKRNAELMEQNDKLFDKLNATKIESVSRGRAGRPIKFAVEETVDLSRGYSSPSFLPLQETSYADFWFEDQAGQALPNGRRTTAVVEGARGDRSQSISPSGLRCPQGCEE
jgi:hypothetical protein